MPIYIYKCECGQEYQELRKVKDRDIPLKCKKCGKNAERSDIGPHGPSIYKGRGFYRTDNL